jgi:putative ABC transport system permease protein
MSERTRRDVNSPMAPRCLSWAILRESLASARSQPVASVVSIVMVAGMCATVLLTTGRAVGAEESILGTFDSAGTRSIVVRADADAGLDTSVLDRLTNIHGIEWVGAFGAARDVQNTSFPGGTKVPLRLAYGTDFWKLGIPAALPIPGNSALASASALEQLGMPGGAGGVVTEAGTDFAVVGSVGVPDYLKFLQPLVFVPQPTTATSPAPVSVLVVIADRPSLVTPVSRAVQSILAVKDVTKVSLSNSEGLATLRALVQGQLGSFGRGLTSAVFALTAILVAAILYGLVMMRRKDFGRRRALGASQSLIVALLLTQMAALSLVGALAGGMVAAIALAAANDPWPGWDFFVAVGLLAIATGVGAAVIPALIAARRDPLKELRVP